MIKFKKVSWISGHPGGVKILGNVIGTDITDDFYRKNTIDETIKHHSFSSSSVIKSNKKSAFDSDVIAAIVDDFNKKYIIKPLLAIHSYSYIATKKMSKMIIAKYIDHYPDDNINNIKDPTFHKFKFRRFKLIDKSTINNNIKFSIIKFTFASNNNGKSYDMDLDYLPGHYIEIQAKVKGQIRSYTPIDGKNMKSFCILVKIYPNCLMSKHLNSLLIGFEIQARDPFEFDNENKLSMHLLYANKSFDGQILNLKEYYMGPLYEKCVYDDSIIDNILSVVHIFNKLSDCREGEEGEGSEGNSFDNIILEILNNQLQSPLLATFPSNFSKQSSSLSNRVTNKLPTELNILNSNYNNNELQDQIEEDQIVEEGLNKYIKDLLNKLSISNKIFVCRPTQMNEIGDILSNDMKFNINNDYILLI
ncbi:13084_t:CDS:2 [Entrophospora sp. SA101]|nr:13084_t:CDS:2 [Entrophospora sp. SA101]